MGGRHPGRRPSATPSTRAASVPGARPATLTEAFARAAGLTAVAQALASARDAQAARLTGWPVGRLLRGRRTAAARCAAARARSGHGAPGAVGQAQQSEVDNAITAFADSVGGGAPGAVGGQPAARRPAATRPVVPRALAGAVHAARLPRATRPPAWWRLVTAWQWLLTVLAAAAWCWPW